MILFVGDKPSKRTDPKVAFKGAACEKRLMEWISILEITEYLLLNSAPSSQWEILLEALYCYPDTPIITLGNNAAKRIDKECLYNFKLPHPSGRNRQINDKEFIRKKLDECKAYIGEFNV